jgi:hypothetical protein
MQNSETYGGVQLGGVANLLSPDELESIYFDRKDDPSKDSRTRAEAQHTLVRMFMERLPPWQSASVVEAILQGLLDGKSRSDLLPSPAGPGRPRKTQEIMVRNQRVDTLIAQGQTVEFAAEAVSEEFGVAFETIRRNYYGRAQAVQ